MLVKRVGRLVIEPKQGEYMTKGICMTPFDRLFVPLGACNTDYGLRFFVALAIGKLLRSLRKLLISLYVIHNLPSAVELQSCIREAIY